MKKIVLFSLLLLTISMSSFGQMTCPYTNYEPLQYWTWPTHTNWFAGQNQRLFFGANGNGAPTISNMVGPGQPYSMYESVASASDENGNMVIYTNGVKLWDGTGAEVAVPGGLKTGAESVGGATGSAVQGVIIVKHPLDTLNYYIFTTDDVISGTNAGQTYGFNYFIYNKVTNTCSAGTRLGNYRSAEMVAATWHANGIDVWITSHESSAAPGSRNFHSYLLRCTGLTTAPVTSPVGFYALQLSANERGSLEFSGDGSKAAATFHNGGGNWDPAGAVQLMDFDNATGLFSNAQKLAANTVTYSAPYDCEFSPSGNRLYVTNQCAATTELGYYDLTAGNAYTVVANVGDNRSGVLEKGGDGNIYMGNFRDFGCGAWQYGSSIGRVSAPDGAASYNQNAIAAANQSVGWGLPNMFVPPRDWLEIQTPPVLTTCDNHDFQTLWVCKTTSAENTPLYENAYSLTSSPAGATASIDAVTGSFTTDTDGAYQIVFTICTITDTLEFTVGTCGCDVEVKPDTVQICAGEAVMLDSLLVSASGSGTWNLEEIAPSPGSTDFGTLNEGVADTIWTTTTNTRKGVYMFVFTVTDGACKDTTYINVNPIPTPSIGTVGPLCRDAAAVVMQGVPRNMVDTTGVWEINGVANATGTFDPAVLGVGTHTVNYDVTINGCTANVDSVFKVNELPVVDVNDSTICAGGAAALFTATSDSTAASYLWSDNGSGTLPSSSGTTPGNYTVQITDVNGCIGSHSGVLSVTPLPTPSITSMGPYCADDAAVAMSGLPAAAAGVTVSWKINGVDNAAGSFDPAAATVGNNTVRYIATVNNCTDSIDSIVVVNPLKDATITTVSGRDTNTYCVFDNDPTVTVAEGGGTWDNPNVSMVGTTATIDLSGLGIVVNERLIYTLDNPCGDKDTIWVTTRDALDATITQVGPYCDDDQTIVTLSAVDDGGVWSGNGILDATNGTFQPSTAATFGAGPHQITYTIAGNCGDVKTIDIALNPATDATITTANTTLCEYDSPITIATVVAGGTWTELPGTNTNGGFNSGTNEFNPTLSGGGIFNLEYSFGGNCPDRDTIVITVIDTADIQITPQADLCDNASAVNMAVTPAGGVWSGNGVNSAGLFTPAAGLVASSPNTLTYTTNTNGSCPVSKTTTVTVKRTPTPSLNSFTGQCVGNPDIVVTPDEGGGTFSASPCAACIADPNSGVFNLTTAGTHTITYNLDTNGCPATVQTSVTVESPEPITYTPPADVCQGSTTPITVAVSPQTGPLGTGTWLGGDFSSSGVFNPAVYGPGDYSGTYSFVTPAGCRTNQTIPISVLEVPTVTITVNNDCTPYTANLTDNTITPTGATLLGSAWSFDNGLSATTQGSATTDYTAAGTYTPRLTNSYSYTGSTTTCSAVGTATANAWPNPVAEFDFGPNPVSILDPTVTFTSVSTGADTYDWNFGAKGSPDSSSNVFELVTYSSEDDDTVDVELIVLSVNGCPDTVTHPVIIQGIFTVYVPNAFTPSDRPDGLNDGFYPQGTNWATEDYEFVILDRWGNLIFKSTTIGEGWDGTVDNPFSRGGIAQQDVYIWKLKVKNRYTGKKYSKVGTVTLVR